MCVVTPLTNLVSMSRSLLLRTPQIQQDYDYEAMPSSEQLAADYSYYFEGGEDYSDYETGAAPGAPAPPPGGKKLIVFKAGRRSLVE